MPFFAGVAGTLGRAGDLGRRPCRAEAVATVPPAVASAVRSLAAELGVEPFAVLLGAFSALLRRLTGRADVVVGLLPPAPLARPLLPPAPLAGPLLPPAPLARPLSAAGQPSRGDVRPVRLTLDDRADFADHVRAVAVAVAAQSLPPTEQPRCDLAVFVDDRRAERLRAVYDAEVHLPAYVEAVLASLVTLLTALVAHPRRALIAAPARPPGHTALPDPSAALPVGPYAASPDGLVERIRGLALSRPDGLAVRGPDGTVTYAELDRLRAAVGAAVLGAGAEPGQAVAVLASRTVALPAVLLGVLGSGARWLLLDPAQPPLRLLRQVEAAHARVLVVCPGTTVPLELAGLATVPARAGAAAEAQAGAAAGDRVSPPAERGYLMATSGTTGEPALVVSGERPLHDFLLWYADRFAIGPSDVTAMLGGLAHDALLRDVFAPLILGGQVRVPPPGLLRDPEGLARWLATEAVTIVHCTPQLARLLGRAGGSLPDVRLVVLAGDRLITADLRTLRTLTPNAELVNGYGTTETPQIHAYALVTASAVDGHGSRPVPVGAGRPGSQLLVVGGGGTPAAVGELGEVLIRSRNLAAGYLDPGVRRDRFGRNPFTADEDDRVYRTGDLGRYEPDGTVVLAGRADHQVKVRGYRVEPGEIEAVLCEHPDIAEAVVVARPDLSGEIGLAGYLVPRRAGVSLTALRDLLARRLPEYARPAGLMLLAELPLTPNGKLDRAALPTQGEPPDPQGAAGTPTERLVAGVWREVLGLPRIGVTDNFFDIGGHSLSIVALHARLQAQVERPPRMVDLFRYPTVRALAAHLDGVGRTPGVDRATRRIAARHGRPRTPMPHRHSPEEHPT